MQYSSRTYVAVFRSSRFEVVQKIGVTLGYDGTYNFETNVFLKFSLRIDQ